MEKLLKNDLLTEYQRNAIHNELIFKLDILVNGARKRDNTSFFVEMSKKSIYTNASRRIKFFIKRCFE